MSDPLRHDIPPFRVAPVRCGLLLAFVLLAMALAAASCGETPVDSRTANVTRRGGVHDSTWVRDSVIYRDSIILKDTIIYRDSILRRDTLVIRDSVVWRDSVVIRDSVMLRTHDSVIVTFHDSLRITIHDSVAITFRDSTRIRDSLRLTFRDSTVIRLHDSVVIVRRDTLIRHYDTNFIRFARIYYRNPDGSGVAKTLLVDSTTKIAMQWSQGMLSLLRIDLTGRPPDDPWADGMLRSPVPYWLRLSIPGMGIVSGLGNATVAGDPVYGSGFGVLQHIRSAPSPVWMTTANPLNSASFVVDRIDTVARTVYSKLRAEFVRPDTLRIDSVRIVLGY